MPLDHRDFWDTGHVKSDLASRAMPEWKTVVVGWKFVAAIIVASWAARGLLEGQPENVTRWSVVAIACTLNVLMFLRIGHHLKELGHGASA